MLSDLSSEFHAFLTWTSLETGGISSNISNLAGGVSSSASSLGPGVLGVVSLPTVFPPPTTIKITQLSFLTHKLMLITHEF